MERFYSKVNKSALNGCHEWTASTNKGGYGQFKWFDHGNGKQKVIEAHRVAWFLEKGEWPTYLCHTCDNNKCVNLEHLYDGSPLTNSQDKHNRGRSNNLKKHGDHLVRRIRREYATKLSSNQIALKYNIPEATVLNYINGTIRKKAGGPIRDRGTRYWTNRYSTGRTGVKSRSAKLENSE